MNITSLEINGNKLNTGKSVLVESYTDPDTHQWYRVYSDGWCEQGGTAKLNNSPLTISLIKGYKDTTYDVILTCGSNDGNWPIAWINNPSKTKTTFWVDGTGNYTTSLRTIQINWIAKGYINLEE